MKPEIKEALEYIEQRLNKYTLDAKTAVISTKLRNLNQVCRELIVDARQRLTVPSVLRRYTAQFPDPSVNLAESSIRNKRAGANKYKLLYDDWDQIAEVILKAQATPSKREFGTEIITDAEIRRIDDDIVRHQVNLLKVRTRSLESQINILQGYRGGPVIQIKSEFPCGGEITMLPQEANDLALNEAEVESLKNFIDTRLIKVRGLRRSSDGSIETTTGHRLSDPCFLDAIEKIVKSYRDS
ncbi:gamma-mobile-trio protein GmtX [Microvirga sp. Mcv34]|uniref:gamma-mobile-trio protein GmtX n=1 Tax=Microvirga sp. Mcv34 TaxID=2926016 RepID=UPI0021C7ECCD|nr:gamma-mobile-trio protein GmtX [Microvirga sp. Mcv34]